MVNKNIFVLLFVYFNIIWIKIFDIDDIIEKVVCVVLYAFMFDFITLFLIYTVNIKLVLIHYLCREMLVNVFVLLNILSDNSKY